MHILLNFNGLITVVYYKLKMRIIMLNRFIASICLIMCCLHINYCVHSNEYYYTYCLYRRKWLREQIFKTLHIYKHNVLSGQMYVSCCPIVTLVTGYLWHYSWHAGVRFCHFSPLPAILSDDSHLKNENTILRWSVDHSATF